MLSTEEFDAIKARVAARAIAKAVPPSVRADLDRLAEHPAEARATLTDLTAAGLVLDPIAGNRLVSLALKVAAGEVGGPND